MVCFYGLPSVMVGKGFTLITSFKYVLIMTLAQLPGYFTAAWLIEKSGRKFVLVTYLIGTAASAFVFGGAETTALLLVSGMLLSFFNLRGMGSVICVYSRTVPNSYSCNWVRYGGVSWSSWRDSWSITSWFSRCCWL